MDHEAHAQDARALLSFSLLNWTPRARALSLQRVHVETCRHQRRLETGKISFIFFFNNTPFISCGINKVLLNRYTAPSNQSKSTLVKTVTASGYTWNTSVLFLFLFFSPQSEERCSKLCLEARGREEGNVETKRVTNMQVKTQKQYAQK